MGNGVWRQALVQGEEPAAAEAKAEPAPEAGEGKAPADEEPPKPKTVAELHPEWANSQQQIGWAQQRATNAENFADQAKLYKSWKEGNARSMQWGEYEFEGGLKPPPLPYKTAAEKAADSKAAGAAKNADTPPAGDAKADGKLAKAEEAARKAEGESKKEELQAQQSAKAAADGDATEKVSVIEPMAYERRQNYNKLKEYYPRPTPEPYIMRTTFY